MNRALVVACLVLVSCGKEAGRVALSGIGAGNGSVELKAGEVALWTDLDIEWEGDAALEYRVTLQQEGESPVSVRCAPLGKLGTKTMWTEKNLGTSHARSGNGKMSCDAKVTKNGPAKVSVELQWTKAPASSVLKKADLVLRQ